MPHSHKISRAVLIEAVTMHLPRRWLTCEVSFFREVIDEPENLIPGYESATAEFYRPKALLAEQLVNKGSADPELPGGAFDGDQKRQLATRIWGRRS